MAEHHLGEDLVAGLLGRSQPPVCPPPEAAGRHRERAAIHQRLAELHDHLAGLDEAGCANSRS